MNLCTNWTDTSGTSLGSVRSHEKVLGNTKLMKDFCAKMDKHANGIGFLMNKNIKNSFLGCCPVSSRHISIRLRTAPFNITVIQAYAPTSDHDDEEVEEFYT